MKSDVNNSDSKLPLNNNKDIKNMKSKKLSNKMKRRSMFGMGLAKLRRMKSDESVNKSEKNEINKNDSISENNTVNNNNNNNENNNKNNNNDSDSNSNNRSTSVANLTVQIPPNTDIIKEPSPTLAVYSTSPPITAEITTQPLSGISIAGVKAVLHPSTLQRTTSTQSQLAHSPTVNNNNNNNNNIDIKNTIPLHQPAKSPSGSSVHQMSLTTSSSPTTPLSLSAIDIDPSNLPSKTKLLSDIQQISEEISKTELLLERLEKVHGEQDDEDDTTDGCNTLVEKMYVENSRRARRSQNILDCLKDKKISYDKPLYMKPSDCINYNKFINEFEDRRRLVSLVLRKRQRIRYNKAKQLGSMYARMNIEWKRKQKIKDGYDDNYYRGLAKIPSMILDEKEIKARRFITNNARVYDAREDERLRKLENPWSAEEKQVFEQKFLKYPKNFSKISSFLNRKSVNDCVAYFYLSKHTVNYKQKLREKLRKKRERDQEKARKKASQSGSIKKSKDSTANSGGLPRELMGLVMGSSSFGSFGLSGTRQRRNTTDNNNDNDNNDNSNENENENKETTDVTSAATQDKNDETINTTKDVKDEDITNSEENDGHKKNDTVKKKRSKNKKNNTKIENNNDDDNNKNSNNDNNKNKDNIDDKKEGKNYKVKTPVIKKEDAKKREINLNVVREKLSDEVNSTKWTNDEKDLFVSGIKRYGNDYLSLAKHICKTGGNKTVAECKSYYENHLDLLDIETIKQIPDITNNNNKKEKKKRKRKKTSSTDDKSNDNNSEQKASTQQNIKKRRQTSTHWQPEEKEAFLNVLCSWGRMWHRIVAACPNRTAAQVKNYFQNYKDKLDFSYIVEEVSRRVSKGDPLPLNPPVIPRISSSGVSLTTTNNSHQNEKRSLAADAPKPKAKKQKTNNNNNNNNESTKTTAIVTKAAVINDNNNNDNDDNNNNHDDNDNNNNEEVIEKEIEVNKDEDHTSMNILNTPSKAIEQNEPPTPETAHVMAAVAATVEDLKRRLEEVDALRSSNYNNQMNQSVTVQPPIFNANKESNVANAITTVASSVITTAPTSAEINDSNFVRTNVAAPVIAKANIVNKNDNKNESKNINENIIETKDNVSDEQDNNETKTETNNSLKRSLDKINAQDNISNTKKQKINSDEMPLNKDNDSNNMREETNIKDTNDSNIKEEANDSDIKEEANGINIKEEANDSDVKEEANDINIKEEANDSDVKEEANDNNINNNIEKEANDSNINNNIEKEANENNTKADSGIKEEANDNSIKKEANIKEAVDSVQT